MKMASNKFQPGVTDFSIDHILNRAGVKQAGDNKSDKFESPNARSFTSSSEDETNNYEDYATNIIGNKHKIEEKFMQYPNFDWLKFTRYNMPRTSRTAKGQVKRTPGRLPRIPFTVEQLNELEKAYQSAPYLSTEESNNLAKQLDLTGVRVKIWFQNRRARDRRDKKLLLCKGSSEETL